MKSVCTCAVPQDKWRMGPKQNIEQAHCCLSCQSCMQQRCAGAAGGITDNSVIVQYAWLISLHSRPEGAAIMDLT